MYGLICFNIPILVWAGEQISIMSASGTTSFASLEIVFIFPTKFPLFSQSDLAVSAVIVLVQISGLVERTLILKCGLLCPIVAIEA